MKLYELVAEMKILEKKMMEYAEENEGDMEGFPFIKELDTMSGDIETKALNVAVYIKNKRALSAAIKIEKGILVKRQKAAENVAKNLTNYLSHFVAAGQEYENAQAEIKWSRGNKLVIPTDVKIESIDEKYIKTSKDFDREEIKKDVKSGEIEWASIDKSKTIKIK